MQRRDFLRALATAGSAAAVWPAHARGPASAFDAPHFDAAAARQPWLQPFKGVSDATQDLKCEALTLSGRWPAGLRGRFYRNGPALHERNGQRYHHWFAGDGMVQQFTLAGGTRPAISHLGRLVRTPKLLAEQRAGRFLKSAYGTHIESEAASGGPDAFNVANTSVIEHAGRVLAMWEGGSAFALDPRSLATQGPVTWQPGWEQMPFSAHPKLDAAGHLWNIGAAGDKLVAWHIDPQGALVKAQVGESPYPGGSAHDAAITERYIVLPLPPIKFRFGDDVSTAFDFQRHEPLRIVVMKKDDITERRVFELPAQMVFHVGNAHETADGQVVLSFVGSPDARFVMQGASQLMAGQPAAFGGSSTQLARLDMQTGRARVHGFGDSVEFPRVHPRLNGRPSRHLLSACGDDSPYFHAVQLRDLDTGRLQRFDYGAASVAEEHLFVPRPGATRELDAWLLGTTFDTVRRVTVLNVFDARHLADGPLAQARLPYALPYGFHGNFTAA